MFGLSVVQVKRSFRLTRSTDFQRVRRFGKSQAHPLIVLVASPNQQFCSRFGLVAGRFLGNAVQRNRAKRLLRAALQPHLPCVIPGWDVVLIARRPLLEASYEQVQAVLLGLLQRTALLRDDHDL